MMVTRQSPVGGFALHPSPPLPSPQPHLHTTELLGVAYKGAPLMTVKGKVTVESLAKSAVK